MNSEWRKIGTIKPWHIAGLQKQFPKVFDGPISRDSEAAKAAMGLMGHA